MDADESESSFDNKMLYELHTIHAWEKYVSNKKPTAGNIVNSSLQSVYQWLDTSACQTFSSCSNPSVSWDGDYVALVKNSTIEIRDKVASFAVFAEIAAGSDDSLCINWSQNSLHLGVYSNGGEVVVYNTEGREVTRINMLGLHMKQFVMWSKDGLHVLGLSIDGLQLSYVNSNSTKKMKTFDFENPASNFFRLSQYNIVLTLHLSTSGYYIKGWETSSGDSEPYLELFNTLHHKHNISKLNAFASPAPTVFCRLEKSQEKFVVVLDNSTRSLYVLYLPSLTVAKHMSFSKIADLGTTEVVVDGGWWSGDIIALLSATGKFILVPFKTMQMVEAEKFKVPSIFIHSPIKSIFVLEQSGEDLSKDILNSLKQMLTWSEEAPPKTTVNFKLYQLLQTSPSILFSQKIENREYGEALLLANRFDLDKNEVYKAQWKLNNSHFSAINDFLRKITDLVWVLGEIESFVPTSSEFASLIIEHGLSIVWDMKTSASEITEPPLSLTENEDEDAKEADVVDKKKADTKVVDKKEEVDWKSKETALLNAKVILSLYTEVLIREEPNSLQFEGELFKRLCAMSLVEVGVLFAKRGTWTALDILMTKSKTRPIVEPYWLFMLSFLPETVDPVVYADILPEFISSPSVSCNANHNTSILEWYSCNGDTGCHGDTGDTKDSSHGDTGDTEGGCHGDMGDTEVGYWDEEEMEDIETDWDISYLPCMQRPSSLTVPASYLPLLGTMTTRSVYTWYTTRANQILSESCLFDHARSLLERGVERHVPLQLYQATLNLLETAVWQLDYQSVLFESVLSIPFIEVLPAVLANTAVEDRVGHIVDVYLPFIRALGSVEVGQLVQEYLVDISSTSLLPVLQVLQSQEFNSLIPKEEQIYFTERCFKMCKQKKNWVPTATDIIKLLNNRDTEYKLSYCQLLLQHLGPMSPSDVFLSLEKEESCEQMLRSLCKEAFASKDTELCELIKVLVDRKIIYFHFSFKVIFEECLEIGDLPTLEKIRSYSEEYLTEDEWQELLERYSQLYLLAAADIDHPYIPLVRYLLDSGIKSPTVCEVSNKLAILEDLKKLCVLLEPAQLDGDKQDLVVFALNSNFNNYLQENLLLSLSEKLCIGSCYTYTLIAEIAYQNANFSYCKRICTKAMRAGSESIVPVCVRLLKNRDYTDMMFKETLFNYTLKQVPVEQIDDLLYIYHTLPSYIEARKRKLSDTDLGDAALTNLKILKVASSNEILDLEDTISNTDGLEELYHWLAARALAHTHSHIDKVSCVENVISRALENPSSDIKIIAAKISDILQGNILKETHDNVNVPRFTYDKTYRRDIIMGLAERESVELAVSLGRKYSLDQWEIHFKHYQWLLHNEHAVPDNTRQVLRSNNPEFRARCARDIYPTLSGTKYNTLAAYFTELADEPHLGAVNKIRAAIPGLNYKEFLAATSPSEQLQILTPLLNDGNVHVIGKMGPNIHSTLTKCAVFLSYCRKYFFHGEGRTLLSYEERWTKVEEMLQFLDQPATEQLVRDICLSRDERITLDLRLQISSNHPHINTFLSCFSGDLFHKYKSSYFQSYLLSFGSPVLLDVILMAMFLDTAACGDVGRLLQVRQPPWTPEQFVDSTVENLLAERTVPTSLGQQEEIRHLFEAANRELFEGLLRNSSCLLPQKSVIDKLKAVCSETRLRPGVLEDVIWALEKYLTTEDDTEMVVYFKTKPLVEEHWPGLDIQPKSVLTDQFFSELCGGAGVFNTCCVLLDILKLWREVGIQPQWSVELLHTIARQPDLEDHSDTTSALLVEIARLPASLSADTTTTCSLLFPAPLSYIFLLASPHPDLHTSLLPDLALPDLENKTLLSLVIERDLYLQLVGTELYPRIVREMTEGRTLAYARAAAGKLHEAGFDIEAVSLLARFTRSSYNTFASYKSFSGFNT